MGIPNDMGIFDIPNFAIGKIFFQKGKLGNMSKNKPGRGVRGRYLKRSSEFLYFKSKIQKKNVI